MRRKKAQRKFLNDKAGVILWLAISIFGVVLCSGLAWKEHAAVKDFTRFIKTTGTVLDAPEVSVLWSDNTDLRIRYTYTVNKQQYEASRVSLLKHRSPSYDEACAMRDQHPRGSSIAVYYDPTDPSFSVLVPHTKSKAWLFVVIALFWLASSIETFFILRRWNQGATAQSAPVTKWDEVFVPNAE